MTSGLVDTSVFIALESGRSLNEAALPDEGFVSVVTSAELRAGVLDAPDTTTLARRLATLTSTSQFDLLPIDAEVAAHWAEQLVRIRQAGRKVNINDLWIAAVARANDLSVVTQDGDFDVIAGAGGPRGPRLSGGA